VVCPRFSLVPGFPGILAYGFARARCPDCGHDFLVAFSCKDRGLCPSCNARRMAETAAHLVDHVIPPLPVRQWVLSVPKRLRWYLEREPRALSAVLRILLRVIEAHLIQGSGAGARARLKAVSFIHRFGASLNRHVHYHCCIIDGVFEPVEEAGDDPQSVHSRPAAELTPEAVAAIAEQVRGRGQQRFARSGLIERDDVCDMRAWENSGFSLDAEVRVGAQDRAGLERLLRYCARPPFALERLERLDDERVVYRLPKPQRDGTTALTLTPLELIDHLAAQLVHRLAAAQAASPSLPRRACAQRAAACGCYRLRARGGGRNRLTDRGQFAAPGAGPQCPLTGALSVGHAAGSGCSNRCPWSVPTAARLSAASRNIAEAAPVEQILTHIGEPPRPPPITPARGPPAWDDMPESEPDWNLLQQPEFDFEFDQRIAW
jgi:hypothetical protein